MCPARNGRSYSYITFYDLTWFFDNALEAFGQIPTGTYEWMLFYDGMYVSSQTFRVTY